MMPAPWRQSASRHGGRSPVSSRNAFARIVFILPSWKLAFRQRFWSLPISNQLQAHLRVDAAGYQAPRNEEFMSMDRLSRVIAGCSLTVALGMVISASGCRSMRSDVPRGKPYSTTGSPTAPGFNSAPHPNTTISPGLYQNNGANAQNNGGNAAPNFDGNADGAAANMPQYGTPSPNASPYGVPSQGKFGAPGTNSGANP
jgi:hypothetical protein